MKNGFSHQHQKKEKSVKKAEENEPAESKRGDRPGIPSAWGGEKAKAKFLVRKTTRHEV